MESFNDVDSNNKEIIFHAYNCKGFQTRKFLIPNENFQVVIKSNFQYCGSSYLYATIKRNDKLLLDPNIQKITVLNQSELNKFSVASEDWYNLFRKIIKAYNSSLNEINIYPLLIKYINEMDKVLHQQSIQVKGAMHFIKATEWKEYCHILLIVGRKLEDFILNITLAEIKDESVINRCLELCIEYLRMFKFKVNYMNLTRNIQDQFSKRLLTIHEFMYKHNNGNIFVNLFLVS